MIIIKINKGIVLLFTFLLFLNNAFSWDIDGDGVDDGEQDLCGDGFCQDWEDNTSCSKDCEKPFNESSIQITKEENIKTEEVQLSAKRDSEDSNTQITITVSLGVLAVFIFIIMLILKKKKMKK